VLRISEISSGRIDGRARLAPDRLPLHWIPGEVTPRATHYGGPDLVRDGGQRRVQEELMAASHLPSDAQTRTPPSHSCRRAAG
jgi:hypothetical protein